MSGFFDQVGTNSQYIIHPEEILADNFALLVTGDGKIRLPEVLSRMTDIFLGRDTASQAHAPSDAETLCQ